VLIEVQLTEHDIDRLAGRVVELLAATSTENTNRGWLDVRGAAAHLSLSENAVRGLVRRRQIPCHRTENGRIRFSGLELDGWVRSGLAESATRT
jgi:hypothetical protein